MNLPVNEIFETIQGEAHWTGTPSIFIRLQGCAVGCPWCDTKHTWEEDKRHVIGFEQMMAKQKDAPTYASCSMDQIAKVMKTLRPRHVVITGGEPCQYDLTQLVEAAGDKSVQVETSGTQQIVAPNAWVTVSPKVGMPGRFKVRQDALERANELKMPVGKQEDIDTLQELLGTQALWTMVGRHVWLQPLSTSKKATALCVKAATEYGWRVSLQAHKFAGLR